MTSVSARCSSAYMVAVLLLGACGSDPVSVTTDGRSQTLDVEAGAEILIRLQTVGPGEYASPPTVSSPAVVYVNAAEVGPVVPAGPTQLFRFRAASRGTAVITFRHTGQNGAVQDTVQVR